MDQFRIRQGYELLDGRGLRVAGPGELVDAGHPAVLAHPSIDSIATRVHEAPAPEPVEEPAAEAQSAERDPLFARPFAPPLEDLED